MKDENTVYNDDVYEALTTAYSYINRLKDGILKHIYMLRGGYEGDRENAMRLAQIIEGIVWVSDVIRATDYNNTEESGIKAINEKIENIVNSFEVGDYIYICDTFEYEIMPILSNWYDRIFRMIRARSSL